jgi:hypothetical protein
MRLATLATESKAYMPWLVASCARHGARLDVLGWGQQWRGFNMKLQLMREYVAGLDPGEVVCFVDAYDVLMLRPVEELEQAFRAFSHTTGSTLVVGCDTPREALHSFVARFLFGKCQGKHLNTGTYIGFAWAVHAMLDGVGTHIGTSENDDQVALTKYCRTRPRDMHIDCDGVFFFTTLKRFGSILDDRTTVVDGRLKVNATYPFFAHGNGQTDMDDLIVRLGYTITPQQRRDIREYRTRAMLSKVPVLLARRNSVWCIALLVCCGLMCCVWRYACR